MSATNGWRLPAKDAPQQNEDMNDEDGRNIAHIQSTHPAERDIDLLLIEELNVDSSFLSWIYGLVWRTSYQDLTFLGAWHSLTHPEYGESDIVVLVEGAEGRKLAILILCDSSRRQD